MFEQQQILKKIEQWAERLPYKTLKIEVELRHFRKVKHQKF